MAGGAGSGCRRSRFDCGHVSCLEAAPRPSPRVEPLLLLLRHAQHGHHHLRQLQVPASRCGCCGEARLAMGGALVLAQEQEQEQVVELAMAGAVGAARAMQGRQVLRLC